MSAAGRACNGFVPMDSGHDGTKHPFPGELVHSPIKHMHQATGRNYTVVIVISILITI